MLNSATNRLITAKDHASVQINIGHLDESGLYNGQFSTFALCGFTRAQFDASSIPFLFAVSSIELSFSPLQPFSSVNPSVRFILSYLLLLLLLAFEFQRHLRIADIDTIRYQ
ncbi:40S ribosomal protein S21 [Trifolium repens]|nr:40S ribosomal protein S21 [Trifolium repens]